MLEEAVKNYGSLAPKDLETNRVTLPITVPPQGAEFLLGWCTKKRYRQAVLDDLEEVFQRDLAKGMTVRRAKLRYLAATLHSITPQLIAAAKRVGIMGLIARLLFH
jgi:hypothetical protein